MRALVGYRGGIMRLEEIPVPEIREGEVLIRIRASGICGGDYIRRSTDSLSGPMENPPPPELSTAFIPGHEAVGTVVAVGSATTDLVSGDRVAISPIRACGTCRACRRGASHLCTCKPRPTPATGGAFAEYAAVLPLQCYRIPDSLSFAEAAMTEPLACCLHAAMRVGIDPGDRVVVLGAGPSAQLFAQIAKQWGASLTVVVDTIVERLELAKRMGTDVVVNPDTSDPAVPGGVLEHGADVAIVTRSSADAMKRAIDLCAPGARLLSFGVSPPGREFGIEAHTIWRKELSIIGSRAYGHTFGDALALIDSGRVRVEPLITRVVTLEQLPAVLAGGSGHHVKTVMLVDDSE